MATEPDPYRTLGVTPTASRAEVKAAYRRLAKANHPDAAGEAALPRFLAIQAAYERLVGPMPGRVKAKAGPAAPKKPWEADPDRSDATHRAYGGRAGRPAGDAGARGARTSSKPGGSSGFTGSAKAGPSETAGDAKAGKRPKRATLGSTSYDGADRETFEPDWAGADWYGTTSGTYWTINPKEYADPRKHGPEYQARARRAAGKRATPEGGQHDPADPEPAIGADGDPNPEPATGSAVGGDPAATTPRHTTSSWWESTSGASAAAHAAAPEAPPGAAPRAQPTAPAPRQPPAPPIAMPPSVSDVWRALATGLPPSLGWRIARAVVAWIPIGLAIGWASGELTGCGRFSATCDPGTAPIVWVVQILVLIGLLALPIVAGWGVAAAAVCLVVAVPTTLFVTATAGAEASQRGASFLGVVLAVAWVAGIVGAASIWRRSTPRSTGPVS